MRSLITLLAVVLLTGCHESGTWKDDPKNWKRIFKTEKPANVKVVHSDFWRSPHFTYEAEYFIQIEKQPDLLLTTNLMKEVVDQRDLQWVAPLSTSRPDWFAPKPVSRYQVWVYTNEVHPEFRLFIDRETGDLFMTDRQL